VLVLKFVQFGAVKLGWSSLGVQVRVLCEFLNGSKPPHHVKVIHSGRAAEYSSIYSNMCFIYERWLIPIERFSYDFIYVIRRHRLLASPK
jgi:hypothetical protein